MGTGVSFTCCTTITKSRKPHRCHWCGERIEVGESYIRIAGVWSGDFGVSSWHPECDEVFKALTWQETSEWDLQDGFDPGMYKRGSKESKND